MIDLATSSALQTSCALPSIGYLTPSSSALPRSASPCSCSWPQGTLRTKTGLCQMGCAWESSPCKRRSCSLACICRSSLVSLGYFSHKCHTKGSLLCKRALFLQISQVGACSRTSGRSTGLEGRMKKALELLVSVQTLSSKWPCCSV